MRLECMISITLLTFIQYEAHQTNPKSSLSITITQVFVTKGKHSLFSNFPRRNTRKAE